VKFAVTLRAAVMVTLQLPVPVHAPLQPVKVDPTAAVGVRTTFVPLLKVALHVDPQLIPLGVDVTEPLPLAATVSGYVSSVKVAVAVFSVFMVTTQLPVPVHAPLQPVKVDPAAAVAVSVTAVPFA
jgi:hypothetical protein